MPLSSLIISSILGGGGGGDGGDADTLEGETLAEVIAAAVAAADGNVDAATLESSDLAAVLAAAVAAADGNIDAATLEGSNLAAVIAAAVAAADGNVDAFNSTLFNGFNSVYYRTPSNFASEVPINKGGTNATTAAGARTNLGIPVLVDVAQGRISVSASDPTADGASSTIYYLPHTGNQISLHDGSSAWSYESIGTGLSLALSGNDLDGNPITADTAYEVVIWSDAGTKKIGLEKWTDPSTRATALTRQDGVLVLDGDTAKRAVGAVYLNASKQVESVEGKRYVENYYNRQSYEDRQVDNSGAILTRTSATWGAIGSTTPGAGWRHAFFVGSDNAVLNAELSLMVRDLGTTAIYVAGIDVDASGDIASDDAQTSSWVYETGSSDQHVRASRTEKPDPGLHYLQVVDGIVGTVGSGFEVYNHVSDRRLSSFTVSGQW